MSRALKSDDVLIDSHGCGYWLFVLSMRLFIVVVEELIISLNYSLIILNHLKWECNTKANIRKEKWNWETWEAKIAKANKFIFLWDLVHPICFKKEIKNLIWDILSIKFAHEKFCKNWSKISLAFHSANTGERGRKCPVKQISLRYTSWLKIKHKNYRT